MGMFRDSVELEADLVKEMAEGLGSQGLRIEALLEKIDLAREQAEYLKGLYLAGPNGSSRPSRSLVNESVNEHNVLVDRAVDALRWLLIQREACGFRTHRKVAECYPIPEKMKLLQS
jgi:hypothetical protein